MSEYLVRIRTDRPASMSDDAWADIVSAERTRGEELCRRGVIASIWRVAGTRENVGIWVADDPDELHREIASLPAFPWQLVEVSVLAAHPLSALARGEFRTRTALD